MYWNTVTPDLQKLLRLTMESTFFAGFRLVGGTALSLQLGHRASVDIDLFTDAEYGKVNFTAIDAFLKSHYNYTETNAGIPAAIGKSWFVGDDEFGAVKVDIYYTDPFICPPITQEGIRIAAPEDIAAMKLEVIGHCGRKKDFWDLHALHDYFSVTEMLNFHKQRYPYSYSEKDLRKALVNFDQAEDDFTCMFMG